MQFVAKEANVVIAVPGSRAIRSGPPDHLKTPKMVETPAGWSSLVQLMSFLGVFAGARIADWDVFANLLKDILLSSQPGVTRMRNDSPLLLALPSHWPRGDLERLVQICFEFLNVPGLYIAQAPLMAVYAANATSGLVVDLGHSSLDITPVLDSRVQCPISFSMPDIDSYLLSLLKEDTILCKELNEAGIPLNLDFARAVKESDACCTFKSADLVRARTGAGESRADFFFNNRKVCRSALNTCAQFSVGSARYRCLEPLFDPTILKGSDINASKISLAEAMYIAVSNGTDPSNRASLWEGVLLTGGYAKIKGIEGRLETEVAPYISASETSHEFQAKDIAFLRIPEFFTEYKNSPLETAFLGSCMVAKKLFDKNRLQ
ncbi:MAG: hypothetical protein SGCHY_001247 [Lobulomycetales sp.]